MENRNDPTGRLPGGLERGKEIRIFHDGRSIPAFLGETIAAALLAAGVSCFRRSPRRNQPRGPYCGMGVCFDCLITVNGRPNVQACREPVEDGMELATQEGLGRWEVRP